MNILIMQKFGIGDCIFIITIARKWISEGHKITWPVLPQFVWQLERAYPDIEWLDCNTVKVDYNRRDEHDWNGYRVVPMAWANEIMGESYNNCMKNKYQLLGLDFNMWRDNAMWYRDKDKEKNLFNTLAGNRFPYKVCNELYTSDAKQRIHIPKTADLLCVNMDPLPGYSLFDWAYILERATEIHTVSTSILYLLELLDITCPIHLYARPTDPQFKQVDYLFTKPYILHAD